MIIPHRGRGTMRSMVEGRTRLVSPPPFGWFHSPEGED